jgi:predicted dienelactone hydrolase
VPLPPQWDPLSWAIGSQTSFENLPIVGEPHSFPVILFSHGSQNNAIDYVYTLEALASFGFIVAAPDHLNNTQDDVRIDFINSQAGFTLIPCFDGLPSPSLCSHSNLVESMTDRAHDVTAVLDKLPAWFGDRADLSRVGLLGHSRGTVTALAAAGGSAEWNLEPDPRVKAIMGLAIGVSSITFGANVERVTVPTLLVAGELDATLPVSQDAFNQLASTDKQLVLIEHANHRHFDSGLCAQTQSGGSIAGVNPRAILDLHTLRGLVINPNGNGVAMDFCGLETFTDQLTFDIRPLVFSLTGFDFASTNVPTTGVTAADVKDEVVQLAVAFFEQALSR